MRKSGWYRVVIMENDEPELAIYYDDHNYWHVSGCSLDWFDIDFVKIYPEMVMTPEGKLVYHKPNEHDPLYNTSQEG